MDTYALHLAMAALVGASVVAVSAYHMHRKTLKQLLEFAKTIERERERDDASVEDGGFGGAADSPQRLRNHGGVEKRRDHDRRKGNVYCRSGSASLPDVTEITGGTDVVEERRNGPVHVDSIPDGLPRLRTLPEGKSGLTSSAKRAAHLIRPTSPKSTVASAGAFDSIEGSDNEDNVTAHDKLDTAYLHANGNVHPGCESMFQNLPDHRNANNGVHMAMAPASMIRSRSVSGDLHSVQPDPVAANILRKEPEQETFARLKISPSETPSPDEVDVYRNLQVCLESRQSYVFREAVAPWEKEIITDPSTPKPIPNPFDCKILCI